MIIPYLCCYPPVDKPMNDSLIAFKVSTALLNKEGREREKKRGGGGGRVRKAGDIVKKRRKKSRDRGKRK